MLYEKASKVSSLFSTGRIKSLFWNSSLLLQSCLSHFIFLGLFFCLCIWKEWGNLYQHSQTTCPPNWSSTDLPQGRAPELFHSVMSILMVGLNKQTDKTQTLKHNLWRKKMSGSSLGSSALNMWPRTNDFPLSSTVTAPVSRNCANNLINVITGWNKIMSRFLLPCEKDHYLIICSLCIDGSDKPICMSTLNPSFEG